MLRRYVTHHNTQRTHHAHRSLGSDATQVWNFERQVDSAWTSIPSFFKSHGYLTLGVGKLWHWGAGPGQQWHNKVAKYFPSSGARLGLV